MLLPPAEFAPVLSEGTSDSLMPWACLILGILIVIYFLRRYAKRGARGAAADPGRNASAEQALHESMDKLLIELQETSREINATIDTKTVVLNNLIQEADRKIGELKKLQEERVVPVAPKAAQPPAPRREDDAPDTPEARRRAELDREIHRLAGEGRTELEIARMTGTPRGEVALVLGLQRGGEGGPKP